MVNFNDIEINGSYKWSNTIYHDGHENIFLEKINWKTKEEMVRLMLKQKQL
jgi:hypothetical protein